MPPRADLYEVVGPSAKENTRSHPCLITENPTDGSLEIRCSMTWSIKSDPHTWRQWNVSVWLWLLRTSSTAPALGPGGLEWVPFVLKLFLVCFPFSLEMNCQKLLQETCGSFRVPFRSPSWGLHLLCNPQRASGENDPMSSRCWNPGSVSYFLC